MAADVKTWKGQHTQDRGKPTRMRKVNRVGVDDYYAYSEVAEERFWVETVEGELSIDVNALFHLMAQKAMRSSRGKSAAAGGRIKFKVTKRHESNVRLVQRPMREGFVELQEP